MNNVKKINNLKQEQAQFNEYLLTTNETSLLNSIINLAEQKIINNKEVVLALSCNMFNHEILVNNDASVIINTSRGNFSYSKEVELNNGSYYNLVCAIRKLGLC